MGIKKFVVNDEVKIYNESRGFNDFGKINIGLPQFA